MQAAVGGNVAFPNLTEIADLFRAYINDTGNNTTGTGTGTESQAGLIMPNSNPDLLTFMRSGIRTLYSDLRNVGDPELVIDNYILSGIPPLAAPNPAIQVGLNYAGYFNGFTWSNQWTLPIGLSKLLAVWERVTNANEDFSQMYPAAAGLPGTLQGLRMGSYEMRQDTLWMPGCMSTIDLRLRGRISFPSSFNVANLDFGTTYVPIRNCGDAVAAKMLQRYAMRFAPEMKPLADAVEKEEMSKVRLEVVRAKQSQENQRGGFGDEAVVDFAISWSWL